MTTSSLNPSDAVHSHTILAGDHWLHEIKQGQILRIIDLEGNQAADTLFYNAHDALDRYSAADTIQRQGNLYLTTGTRLMSTRGHPLLTIIADTCGRHDTLGGACSRESNTMRYSFEVEHMHACRDSFLCGIHEWGLGLGKRDITCNINFFMNVPVEPDGSLGIVDGISAPGMTVDLKAEMDVIVVVSNCPQINNPCNGFNPTPVRMIVTA